MSVVTRIDSATGGLQNFDNNGSLDFGIEDNLLTHTHPIPSQGSGNAHPIVQPTIVLNYILRIL